MSDTPLSDSDAPPPSLTRHVDQLCDAFEAAWKKAGSSPQRPRIEDFICRTPEPERSALLQELVLLEVYYRRQRGESVRYEDYGMRFPLLDVVWLAGVVANH